jgi:hypothetical protein
VANELLWAIRGVLPSGFEGSMYVDNITISGPKPILPATESRINETVRTFGFELRKDKRTHVRMVSGCRVCGLSVIPTEGESKGRVAIPQKKRKKIRAVLHQARFDPELIPRALGMVAFAKSVYGDIAFFPPDIKGPYLQLMGQLGAVTA